MAPHQTNRPSTVETDQEVHINPGIHINLAQLDLLNDRSKSFAVRFKTYEMSTGTDLPKLQSALERVDRKSDLGKVRDECAARGLKLVITKVEENTHIYGRIVNKAVPLEELANTTDNNKFKRPTVDFNTCDEFAKPNYWIRSHGVASYDVSRSPHFPDLDEAARYLNWQQIEGFRGHVFIQGIFTNPGGGAVMPFVAEIMVTDEGIEIKKKMGAAELAKYAGVPNEVSWDSLPVKLPGIDMRNTLTVEKPGSYEFDKLPELLKESTELQKEEFEFLELLHKNKCVFFNKGANVLLVATQEFSLDELTRQLTMADGSDPQKEENWKYIDPERLHLICHNIFQGQWGPTAADTAAILESSGIKVIPFN